MKKLGIIAEEMRATVPKGELQAPKPYVRLAHIPRSSLALAHWETATELGSKRLEFKKGEDLFVTIRLYFHKVSVAPFDGSWPADTIAIAIRAPRAELYAVIVACVFSDPFVAKASATTNGAKMLRANWDVLEKFALVIPKTQFVEKFSALYADIIAQQRAFILQIQNPNRTRHLVLPLLRSGQINLKGYDG